MWSKNDPRPGSSPQGRGPLRLLEIAFGPERAQINGRTRQAFLLGAAGARSDTQQTLRPRARSLQTQPGPI